LPEWLRARPFRSIKQNCRPAPPVRLGTWLASLADEAVHGGDALEETRAGGGQPRTLTAPAASRALCRGIDTLNCPSRPSAACEAGAGHRTASVCEAFESCASNSSCSMAVYDHDLLLTLRHCMPFSLHLHTIMIASHCPMKRNKTGIYFSSSKDAKLPSPKRRSSRSLPSELWFGTQRNRRRIHLLFRRRRRRFLPQAARRRRWRGARL
jgi:hypothetical protein